MTWTLSDIDKLQAAGKIRGYIDVSKKVEKVTKSTKKAPEGLKFIMQILNDHNIPYTTEHRFHDKRRFRFDIAIVDQKIAIEYEGLVATGKKGGHQTKKHYTSNCDKYNLAAALGWTVYRYTFLNYKNFESDLKIMKTDIDFNDALKTLTNGK